MATNAEAEEVMLDENAEAAQHKFYMTAAVTVGLCTMMGSSGALEVLYASAAAESAQLPRLQANAPNIISTVHDCIRSRHQPQRT